MSQIDEMLHEKQKIMHDDIEDEENKDFKMMLEKEMMQPMS